MKWIILSLAPIGAISCKNWILIWAFLELSSFRFLVLSKNKSARESIIKYFLIQTISSIFILCSIRIKISTSTIKTSLWIIEPTTLIIIRLLVKSGLAPLHFWIPKIRKGLRWDRLILFLTIQRIGPITLTLSIINTTIIIVVILICSIIGTIRQMSTINLKILITYSSVSHSGWILLGRISKIEIYYLYIIVYTIIIVQMIVFLLKQKVISIISMKKRKIFNILLISLGGLPPLLGFFPKWISILTITLEDKIKLICILIVLLACLNVYIYMRISSSGFLKRPKKLILKVKFRIKIFTTYIINLITLPLLLLFSI
jgi:NADH-ubiquinone oxidoreductase chain 2